MLKASELVAFCYSMLGMPYWYGTCVYKCTASLRNRKAKQYPSHYKSARTATYNSHITKQYVCMDCVGMIKGFFWTDGGVGVADAIGNSKTFASKYGSNGCPDKSANGMFSWCKSKGAKYGNIDTLPDVPGILLFSPGHTGVYVGGGYAIEARGFNYGVVKTKVSARSWKTWAYMPSSVLEYDTLNGSIGDSSGDESTTKTYKLGDRIIKKGVKGDDVAELQRYLIQLSCGDLGDTGTDGNGVDGDCGSKTVVAIKNFQQKYDLEVDGEYGPKSHAKLMEVVDTTFQIRVTGNSVNIRNMPNTAEGKIVRVVHKNDLLKSTGTDAASGWYKLSEGNYISNKYAVRI